MRYLFTILFILTFSVSTCFAKGFANQYIEFELPNGWECMLEGSEWVCQSNNADRKKEAIIIMAAKVRGEQDNLDAYKKYLGQTKTYKLPGVKTSQTSESKSTTIKSVNNHQWVDALHLNSEIPGFYTRYLATVKADLGVAVTFSVSREFWDAYSGVFDKIISTMKVFRQSNANISKLRQNKDFDGGKIEDSTFIPDGALDLGVGRGQKKKKSSGSGDSSSLIYLLIAAVVGFVIMKSRKKKGKKKKKSKKA